MAWKITFGDQSILLDDLTGDDYFEVCKDHPEMNWLRLYSSPASHPGALYDLIVFAAKRLGVEPPAKPSNVRESIALLACIDQVEDDLPAAFDEHGAPLANGEADETTTNTSSTSTKAEGGIPDKQDPPN